MNDHKAIEMPPWFRGAPYETSPIIENELRLNGLVCLYPGFDELLKDQPSTSELLDHQPGLVDLLNNQPTPTELLQNISFTDSDLEYKA